LAIEYASNESGKFELYLTSFPVSASKLQVSTAGGKSPRWRHDGKQLFFVSDDRHIMVVDVGARGNSLALGVPRALAAPTVNVPSSGLSSFGPVEVSPNGKRLLVSMTKNTSGADPATLVINWPAELKK
jgi:eukaryotic-like serine/threonine-protein kinase